MAAHSRSRLPAALVAVDRGGRARKPPAADGHRAVATQPRCSGRTGPACPRPRRSAAKSRSRSTTGPIRSSRPRYCRSWTAHDARATFFCIGARAEREPQLVRACIARGHAVENHSYQHRNVFRCSARARCAASSNAHSSSLARSTGRAPTFFRAPAGLRSPLLEPVLQPIGAAARELDAPRLRYRTQRCGARARAADARICAPATSCCCTTGMRHAPPRVRPSCSTSCHHCSRRSRAPA